MVAVTVSGTAGGWSAVLLNREPMPVEYTDFREAGGPAGERLHLGERGAFARKFRSVFFGAIAGGPAPPLLALTRIFRNV